MCPLSGDVAEVSLSERIFGRHMVTWISHEQLQHLLFPVGIQARDGGDQRLSGYQHKEDA